MAALRCCTVYMAACSYLCLDIAGTKACRLSSAPSCWQLLWAWCMGQTPQTQHCFFRLDLEMFLRAITTGNHG